MESHDKGRSADWRVLHQRQSAKLHRSCLNVTDQPLATLPESRNAAEPGSAGKVHGRIAVKIECCEGHLQSFRPLRLAPGRSLTTHCEYRRGTAPAADHLFVSFGRFFQRKLLDHRAHSRKRAEVPSCLRNRSRCRKPILELLCDLGSTVAE